MKTESVTAKKKKIKALKAELAKMQEHCKDCEIGKWECGHCAEPKFELQLAIDRLEREVAV